MKTNIVPKIMKEFSNSWIDNNPEYEYRFFVNEDIISFISEEFPQYFYGYNKIMGGSSKSDFFRYLVIY